MTFNGPEGLLPLVGFNADGTLREHELELWRPRYKDPSHPALIVGHHRDGRVIRPMMGGAEKLYSTQNSTRITTAAAVAQPTGTAIRTMLQIASGATIGQMTVVEWGVSYNGSAAAAGIPTEFFNCTGAATMSTALAATDVVKWNTTEASSIQYSTALSGFATAAVTEGTVANAFLFDLQHIQPTNQYVKQWPLGREPVGAVATFFRVRTTSAATVNAYIYLVWSE